MSSAEKNDILSKIIDNFLTNKSEENPIEIVQYLLKNSSVDGSINLDLVRSFLNILEKKSKKDMNGTWKLALKLAQFPFEKIPEASKDKQEFIVLLGTWSIGLLAGINPAYIELATPVIQSLVNDPKTQEVIKSAKEKMDEVIKSSKDETNKIFIKTKEVIENISLEEKIEEQKRKFLSMIKRKSDRKQNKK